MRVADSSSAWLECTGITSGNGGGVPPNDGHSAWWLHQPHSLLGFGRKSRSFVARSTASNKAISVRSNRASSAASGVKSQISASRR